MKVQIMEEHGYEMALYGVSLSFKDRIVPYDDWWTEGLFTRMQKLTNRMFNKDGGHNKFLEAMVVWLKIEASRSWWQEFDTYRVGTTKQSESTMHTIQYRPVVMEDFEEGIDQTMVDAYNKILAEVTDDFTEKVGLSGDALNKAKSNLPEGYLQTRLVCLNYKVLRNIIMQRRTHRFHQWKYFIKEVQNQVMYPQLLEVK